MTVERLKADLNIKLAQRAALSLTIKELRAKLATAKANEKPAEKPASRRAAPRKRVGAGGTGRNS